jgi:hypothetical protein
MEVRRMVSRFDLSSQPRARAYDRNFTEAMMPNEIDQWMNGFIRWVNSAKLGGGPAPAVKAFAVLEKHWPGYYPLTQLAPPPVSNLTPEEWKRVELWPFYIWYTNKGERATHQQRIEILSQVMPDAEQHRVEALARYDAIFFVHVPTNEKYGHITADINYYAAQCLALLESWHEKPADTLVTYAESWQDEYRQNHDRLKLPE